MYQEDYDNIFNFINLDYINPSYNVTPRQTNNRGRGRGRLRGRGGPRGRGGQSSRGGQRGRGGQHYRNSADAQQKISPLLSSFQSLSLNGTSQNRNGQNRNRRGGQSSLGGQNSRGGQAPRLRSSEVNMPTGKRISVTIPNCKCATPKNNLKLVTLRPEGNLGKWEYDFIATEMKSTIKEHKLQEFGGGRFETYEIVMIQKVVNCCVWKEFREVQQEIAKVVGYVNEKMLFHGTPAARSIVQFGFDENKAKPNGMFGAGIYFAQHSSKSNQYVYGYLGGNGCPRHSDRNCYTCERKMLLCRVTLGKSHRMTNALSYSRPPSGYNSIEGLSTEKGGSLQYPEYVVYRGQQAYPEYLITYKIKE